MPDKTLHPAVSADELLEQFHRSRKYSSDLIKNLTVEDCQSQSMEDASPAKWHLAHVTWFYEVMVLKPYEENFAYWNPAFAVLFNSYYNGIEGVGGLVDIGFEGKGFHFDNEKPLHRAFNPIHFMANRLVTNFEWIQFIEDDGYQNFKWWLDAGWAWLQANQISAPLYWNKPNQAQFFRFSLNGDLALDMHAPVANISYFEADAFARWASQNIPELCGARLPTEFEWEAFAKSHPSKSQDLFGKVWQWTSSNYNPYPGYLPWTGAAGEYNGKFMVNQMVLRGSSAYTTQGHSRISYRNFFPTHARWQMTGLRLAKF